MGEKHGPSPRYGEHLSRKVMVSFTEKQFFEIDRLAKKMKMNISEVVREAVLEAVRKTIPLKEAFEGVDIPNANQVEEWPHDLVLGSPERSVTFRFSEPNAYQKFIDVEALEILPYLDVIARQYGKGPEEDVVIELGLEGIKNLGMN